jgi:hypothetical protein
MDSVKRAKIELQAIADKTVTGMSINYTAHNPSIINGVPHKWHCAVGSIHNKMYFSAFGVTEDDAVLKCLEKYQEG